jgi:hypothetical protein
MSIEQKIAEILAESKLDETEVEAAEDILEDQAEDVVAEEVEEVNEEELKASKKEDEANNKKNAVDKNPQGDKAKAVKEEKDCDDDDDDEDDEDEVKVKKESSCKKEEVEAEDEMIVDVQEDVDALVNGEDLSEEFKAKATTIFEAAIVSRVKQEVAKLEEEFEAKLEEAVAESKEGLVEKVDGYLNYVVEQWITQNEIALEHGMKSEILEGFVGGLKGLFEEHYIDIPEEKFDVLGALEEETAELKAKLDEQVAANVELNKVINESKRDEIVKAASADMTETEKEKFLGLAEELAFEDSETFEKKVQTIRENYFNGKTSTNVESVVTDSPVEELTEDAKPVDPQMARYLNAIKNKQTY